MNQMETSVNFFNCGLVLISFGKTRPRMMVMIVMLILIIIMIMTMVTLIMMLTRKLVIWFTQALGISTLDIKYLFS